MVRINDFKEVQELVKQRDRLISRMATYDNRKDDNHDDKGYYCHISSHRDGTGNSLDLTGCCIGNEVYASVELLLNDKLNKVEQELLTLGLDTSNTK